MISSLGNVEYREGLGRLATGQGERCGAPFERGDTLLEHVLSRVLNAGVNVAELGERKQIRGMLGAVKNVGRGLVDRHGTRLGGRVGTGEARVYLLGFKLPLAGLGHDSSFARFTRTLRRPPAPVERECRTT